jgi:hypothetical protein
LPDLCLDYLNNRYHDPQLGSFVSVDPLVAVTRDAYGYGNSNPVTFSDPLGLCASTPSEGAACFGATGVVAGTFESAAAGGSQASIMGDLQTSCAFRNVYGGCGMNSSDAFIRSATAVQNAGWKGDPWASCMQNRSSAICGAPPNIGWYDDIGLATLMDHLINDTGDGVDGAVAGVTRTAYVLRGRGKNGKHVVGFTAYRDGIGDLPRIFPRSAGVLEVRARFAGRLFFVADAAFTGYEAWGDSAGQSMRLRLGYTAVETAVVLAGSAGGAALGGKGGVVVCAWAGIAAAGCGFAGGVIGGIAGGFAADHATDWVMEVL